MPALPPQNCWYDEWSRWSTGPSVIMKLRRRRQNFSIGISSVRPMPPWICMQRSAASKPSTQIPAPSSRRARNLSSASAVSRGVWSGI